MRLNNKITGSLLALLLFSSFAYGQRYISLPFLGGYDEDATILLGISYSAGFSHYALKLNKDWQGSDILPNGEEKDHVLNLKNIRSIASDPRIELNVGIPIDYRLNDLFYINIIPSFNFVNEARVEYTGEISNGDGNFQEKSIQRKGRHALNSTIGRNFNNFNLPFDIKYRSEEKVFKGNGWDFRYRGYLLGGVRYTRWLGIEKEYRDLSAEVRKGHQNQALVFHKDYYSWEAGVGFDLFFYHFKMSPNIKYVQSFSNILGSSPELLQGNLFMAPVHSAKSKSIFLTLIFQ